MDDRSRRYVLKLLGAGFAGTLTGCSALQGAEDDSSVESSTATAASTSVPTPPPTQTEEPNEIKTETENQKTTEWGEEYILDVQPTADSQKKESLVFNSPEEANHADPYGVDLQAMDRFHENDLETVTNEHPKLETWVNGFIEDKEPDIDFIEDIFSLNSNYPNNNEGFDTEKAMDSEDLQEATVWLNGNLQGFDNYNHTHDGRITERDAPQHAPLLEEAAKNLLDTENIHLYSHPIWEDKTGGYYRDDAEIGERSDDHQYHMIKGVDVETGETINIIPSFIDEGVRQSAEKVLTRKLNEEGEIDVQRHSETREWNFKLENSPFLPEYDKWSLQNEEIEMARNKPYDPESWGPLKVEDIKRMPTSTEFYDPFRFGVHHSEAKENQQTLTPTPERDTSGCSNCETPTETPEPTPTPEPVIDKPGYELAGIDYEEAARYAGTALRRMVTSLEDDITEKILDTEDLAITQNYLNDIIDEMRRTGDDISFEDIYDQAKMVHGLAEDDGRYVISGTAENPVYTKVDNSEIIQKVWQDEEGEYNNFTQAYLDGATAGTASAPTGTA